MEQEFLGEVELRPCSCVRGKTKGGGGGGADANSQPISKRDSLRSRRRCHLSVRRHERGQLTQFATASRRNHSAGTRATLRRKLGASGGGSVMETAVTPEVRFCPKQQGT